MLLLALLAFQEIGFFKVSLYSTRSKLLAANEIKPEEEAKHKDDPVKNTLWDTLSVHTKDTSLTGEWSRGSFNQWNLLT